MNADEQAVATVLKAYERALNASDTNASRSHATTSFHNPVTNAIPTAIRERTRKRGW